MAEEVRLPFDPRKQLAVLGHLMTRNTFFQQGKQRIRPEWFNDQRAGKVYNALLEFNKQFARLPTVDELRGSKGVMQEKQEERSAMQAAIESALLETKNYGVDVVRNELTYWLHARLYREGMEKSTKLYNDQKFEECYKVAWEKIQEIRSTRFDEDIALGFSNPCQWLNEAEQQYDGGLTLGLKIFDDALVPSGDAKTGALLRGDTTVFLAPSNVGKTTTLITIARHNILAGKDVLFFTHEGRKEDIRLKMLCCVLQMTQPEVFSLYKTEEGPAVINAMVEIIEKHLTYVPWSKPGMTVEDLVPVILRRQEERIAETGKGYDLLVDDYPSKLTTDRAKGGQMAQRAIDSTVYDYFVQLALDQNFHSLLAIQTNRQGSMANRDDERLLTMEDVRESWDVMTMATNVITINRDSVAAARKRVTYYVAKSRSSATGRAIVCNSNYAAGLSHSEEMGGTWYTGTETLSDQIDQYLLDYKGKAIPEGTAEASSSK